MCGGIEMRATSFALTLKVEIDAPDEWKAYVLARAREDADALPAAVEAENAQRLAEHERLDILNVQYERID